MAPRLQKVKVESKERESLVGVITSCPEIAPAQQVQAQKQAHFIVQIRLTLILSRSIMLCVAGYRAFSEFKFLVFLKKVRMKRFFVVFIILLFSRLAVDALDLEIGQWSNFEGTLGKTGIQLALFRFENDEVKGTYCYKKYETHIMLSGKISGNKIELTESSIGKTTGYFSGTLFTDEVDRFEGTWKDPSKTKSIAFKLTLTGVKGSSYENRYNDVMGSNEEVEAFMKKTKAAIAGSDREWLANHIFFPLNCNVNGKLTQIKGSKQFIEKFDLIFTDSFKQQVAKGCTCNMFSNYRGVMLGNGEIWISNTAESTEKKPGFIILSVNN